MGYTFQSNIDRCWLPACCTGFVDSLILEMRELTCLAVECTFVLKTNLDSHDLEANVIVFANLLCLQAITHIANAQISEFLRVLCILCLVQADSPRQAKAPGIITTPLLFIA